MGAEMASAQCHHLAQLLAQGHLEKGVTSAQKRWLTLLKLTAGGCQLTMLARSIWAESSAEGALSNVSLPVARPERRIGSRPEKCRHN